MSGRVALSAARLSYLNLLILLTRFTRLLACLLISYLLDGRVAALCCSTVLAAGSIFVAAGALELAFVVVEPAHAVTLILTPPLTLPLPTTSPNPSLTLAPTLTSADHQPQPYL